MNKFFKKAVSSCLWSQSLSLVVMELLSNYKKITSFNITKIHYKNTIIISMKGCLL